MEALLGIVGLFTLPVWGPLYVLQQTVARVWRALGL